MDKPYSDDFFRTFKPDRRRHVHKISNVVKTNNWGLTSKMIEDAVSGTMFGTLSFFSSPGLRDYFGIDIDDHDYAGWNGVVPNEILKEKYTKTVDEIGQFPSIVFRSPRGIHAFWFLIEALPSMVIEGLIKERLNEKIKVEILPTNAHALAVPLPRDCIDNDLQSSVFTGFSGIMRYDPKMIFGNDFQPGE